MGEDETAIESAPRTLSGRVCSFCHHFFDRRGGRSRSQHAPDGRGHRVKQFELAALPRVVSCVSVRLLFAQPNGLFAIGRRKTKTRSIS